MTELTTVEELDALPDGAIIRLHATWDDTKAAEKFAGEWVCAGIETAVAAAALIPCQLLWDPRDTATP